MAPMRLLVIEQEPDAGIGVFADPIAASLWQPETWRPTDQPPPSLEPFGAVISLGASANVDQLDAHPWIEPQRRLLAEAIERRLPTLGVCFGSQLLAAAAGAHPGPATSSEIGFFEVELTAEGRSDPLLSALPSTFDAFQWHSYHSPPPPGATELATSPVCTQAYRAGESAWGIQFHAEVSEAAALTWTRHHHDDPAFERNGLEPESFADAIRSRMPAWNELGRGLCARFCELAATA